MISKNRTLYGTAIVVLFWYILHLTIKSTIIPNPYDTIINFIKIFPKTLSLHLATSLVRIVIAVFVSMVLGTGIGLLTGMNERADALLNPIIYILYPIPKIAFLPVIMILFGLGDLSKIILIVTIIIFQIIVSTRDGVKELSKELFYSVRSLGMNKIQMYRHMIIPAILPKIITSIRISIGTSIAVLFFGETYATRYGIGYYIMNSWSTINYVEMFSGILGLSLMGLGLFKLVDIVEDKVCGWTKL